MIIQMAFQMSGGRYDDQAWPPPGTDFEVPDEEGEALVRDGNAVRVSGTPVAAGVSQPAPAGAPVPPPPLDPPFAKSEPPAKPVPEPASEPAVEEMAQPAPGDPKAAWVDYAVSRGADRTEAEYSTKVQLQAAYGGRL
jgi:hypothetical protein